MAHEADLHIRRVEGFHTTELLGVLRLFANDRVDHVVDRHDAEDMAAFVDDRYGEEVVLRDQSSNLLAVDERPHTERLPLITDRRDDRCAFRRHELAQ